MAVTTGQMNLRVDVGTDLATAQATGFMILADMTGETEAESYLQVNRPAQVNGMMRLIGLTVAEGNEGLMRLTCDQ